jgi:phage gpG-like protein
MIRVQVQLDSARALLALLAARLELPAALLASAEPIVAGAIERNFDEEGRPLPWPPLAPATLRRKPAGLRILERTGRLRRSIHTRVEGERLIASTDLPYAAAHQFGAPRRRLPARPFLVLTPAETEAVAQSVADSLMRTGDAS